MANSIWFGAARHGAALSDRPRPTRHIGRASPFLGTAPARCWNVQRPHHPRCSAPISTGDAMGDDREGAAEKRTDLDLAGFAQSEEHTSELQSLMRISYAVFRLE